MGNRSNRRQFIQGTAAAGIGYWVAGGVAAEPSKSPNEKIRFACIGIGGKGDSDSDHAAVVGDIVAICDVRESQLEGKAKKGPFAKAKKYTDFRKMFEELGNSIDAVTVSTPDHTHAVAAAMAIKNGKHVYCQKPLTHSIYEARVLGELAHKHGVKTQMGNQGTALTGVRQAAQLIKGGSLGTVKEVHVWTNRPIWPQGIDVKRPSDTPEPIGVNWDSFIGPAKMRPYHPSYFGLGWRGFWDFGTGALGDMACHTMNMPFMGLNLRHPTSVEAEADEHNKETYPKSAKIKFEFPELDGRAALQVYWYDGGRLPSSEVMMGAKTDNSGCIVIGEKGALYSPNDYGAIYQLLPRDNFKDFKKPEWTFRKPPSGNNDLGQMKELAEAITGGGEATANFPDYAGPLTETILLGNLAIWSGKKIEWDAKNMKATNAPELELLVKHEYREGWSL
ncbi:Gfo/Idh/MocA family oxidoreductase [bacterium]|nr:Gfo/Idh/MocA family oxidoreductase [bacterium]